jgi:hypothetical protein
LTNSKRRPKIVVADAGIAGSLIVSGLRERQDCNLICLERVGPEEQGEAGTGPNMGPNAIKCLRARLPREAETIVSNSLPWNIWTVALTAGQMLMNLRLDRFADNALLRESLRGLITYDAELLGCGQDTGGSFADWRDRRTDERRRV